MNQFSGHLSFVRRRWRYTHRLLPRNQTLWCAVSRPHSGGCVFMSCGPSSTTPLSHFGNLRHTAMSSTSSDLSLCWLTFPLRHSVHANSGGFRACYDTSGCYCVQLSRFTIYGLGSNPTVDVLRAIIFASWLYGGMSHRTLVI